MPTFAGSSLYPQKQISELEGARSRMQSAAHLQRAQFDIDYNFDIDKPT